jgi:hypothetical protein
VNCKVWLVKDAKVTLSLDLTNPRALRLFPLIFAYNYVSTEVGGAMRAGDMVNLASLQTPLKELRHELERRGVLGHFLKLKALAVQELLELSFWQARTFGEIARLKNLSRRKVRTDVRQALEKLNRHLCSEPHQDEDHLDEVLLALNECGSVRRAAKKLEVGEDVLKTFMERVGIRARTVFEIETGEQHR